MDRCSPQFGDFSPGQVHHERPGAYGIAIGDHGLLLVVTVGDLVALPGGGLEPNETFEEGLLREFREETGYRVGLLECVGQAGQYVYARKEQTHYNKICRFYRVALMGGQERRLESDHHLCWISLDDAARALTEEAHRWAVQQAGAGGSVS